MSHTPGPWRNCDSPSNFQKGKRFIRPADSEALIATVSGEMKSQELHANAHLIAAAPELLAMCKQLADDLEDGHWSETKRILRQLIAKAEGK